MQHTFLRFIVLISILLVGIVISVIFGSLVDEGIVPSSVQFGYFWGILIGVMIIPCLFLRYQNYIGLLIYGILSIIGGIIARYYEYIVLIRRGVGVYGNFTPIVLIIAGMLISGISMYYYMLSQKNK